jgi:hypothetical protein
VSRWDFDFTGGDAENGATSALTNGITPDTAVDEVETVQNSDRSIHSIVIALELNLNLFCDGLHDWFPIGVNGLENQKISPPVCLQRKQGG